MTSRLALAIFACAASLQAAVVESGTFRLHKFEQAIGEEKYEIARDGDALTLTSSFHFRDRGSLVDLKATLHLKPDYAPDRLEIKGKTSRFSTIDSTVTAPAGGSPAFPIPAYAPISVQMALVRYWAQHGRPSTILRAPAGAITIEPRGQDTVTIQGHNMSAERYTVRGLIWGRETLWLGRHAPCGRCHRRRRNGSLRGRERGLGGWARLLRAPRRRGQHAGARGSLEACSGQGWRAGHNRGHAD